MCPECDKLFDLLEEIGFDEWINEDDKEEGGEI